MITTVTANPAIDRTIVVENLKTGSVNRVVRSRVDAGGKGINVAKNLKNFGNDVTALGLIGPNGQYIVDCLNELGIKSHFIRIKNDTRTNIKISDLLTMENTDINEAGPEVSKYELNLFKMSIFEHSLKSDVLVLSGSLPGGVSKYFYADVIKDLRGKGVKILLDADKEALLHGIAQKPHMIKPNIHELEEITGKVFNTVEDVVKEGEKLNASGIPIVAVSMGDRGSVVITDENIYIVKAVKVDIKGTVGAGDAFVAGFAHGIHNGLPIEETIRIAAAASTAVIMKEGTRAGTIDEVNALKDKIQIEKIER